MDVKVEVVTKKFVTVVMTEDEARVIVFAVCPINEYQAGKELQLALAEALTKCVISTPKPI